MTKIVDYENTSLLFAEGSAPATPAAGTVRLYAKADSKLYIKDDTGTETDITAGGGGGGSGTVTSVDVAGGTTGLTTTGGPVTTSGTITLTGTLNLANGGTGASLSDPGGDRILFWDDSAGAMTWLSLGTGMTFSGTSLDLSANLQSWSGIAPSAKADDSAVVHNTGAETVAGAKTFTSNPIIDVSGATASLTIEGDAGQVRSLNYRTGSTMRWAFRVNNTAEGGSNAGSDLEIKAYNDAGSLIADVGTWVRSTGVLTLSVAPAHPTPTVGDNSTQSATTAFVTTACSMMAQNSQSGAYTLVLADAGKHILHPSADTTARIFTIPANSSVAFPVGTVVTFVNQNAGGVITIAITTDTMRLAGAGTTGSRTLAANGVATAIKLTSTEWIISGTGLT